jgi:hypothetical protein
VQEDDVPEAIFPAIATALAEKAPRSLYGLVEDRFERRKKALDVLDAADGAAPESPQVLALAEELQTAGDYDPEFGEQLRAQWAAIQPGVPTILHRASATDPTRIDHGAPYWRAQKSPPPTRTEGNSRRKPGRGSNPLSAIM